VILVLLLVFRHNKVSSEQITKEKVQLSKLITKPAQKAQLQLPDGSIVWLNASSNLTYDKDFGKDLREVNLTGEAFFDVAKDAAHPFIIHTKVVDVKVLGTQFNVRAYPNDAYTETSLIRGSVELTVKNRHNEKRYLKPYEKVMIANDIPSAVENAKMRPKPFEVAQSVTYDTDSTIVETSWVENKLIFHQNETFREVALRMERWYGVRINFADEEVAEIRVYGSFTTEPISQALDALKESFKFNYTMTGNNILITK
jgi:ferric-dicitrate binding protein FerR (iron transport regulator)